MEKIMKLRQKIEDELLGEDEYVILADGFEEAFVGIGRQFGNPIAVYDKSKCIEILMDDMSEEDAYEYFSYNVDGAYVGEETPIFLEFFEKQKLTILEKCTIILKKFLNI
jgi:hypothetical protein